MTAYSSSGLDSTGAVAAERYQVITHLYSMADLVSLSVACMHFLHTTQLGQAASLTSDILC